MKRIIAIFIGLGIMLSFGGCADQQKTNAADSITQTKPIPSPVQQTATIEENVRTTIEEEVQPSRKASLAGINLGDSTDILEKKFGKAIKVVPQEQPSYYGQAVSSVEYNNGIRVFVDTELNTILEISVESGDYETNLGLKVGDSSDDVLGKYNSNYKLFKGDNSIDFLKGWYTVEEGELLIFDFKKGDDTHYNENINSEDRIVSITLSHPMYFD